MSSDIDCPPRKSGRIPQPEGERKALSRSASTASRIPDAESWR